MDTVKINKLEIENVKRIKAVRLVREVRSRISRDGQKTTGG